MQFTYLLVVLSITVAPSLSQNLTPNLVTSLLQGILSPKNPGHVMPMLSTAANQRKTLSNVPKTIIRRFVVDENLPKTVQKSDAPNRMTHLVEIPSKKCMSNNVMVQNPIQAIVKNGNQMVLPNNMVVQRRPEKVLPKNMIIQNGEVSLPRNVIVRNNEMPRRLVVQNNDFTVPKVVQEKVFKSPPTEYLTVPQQKIVVRNENPFLPVASPFSPVTALSSTGLPSAILRSRGQFLRKIPIPPPTI